MNIEIKPYHDPDDDIEVMAIYIDGEVVDWGIPPAVIEELKVKNKVSRFRYWASIQKHFMYSLSETLGKTVTLKELNEMIEKTDYSKPEPIIDWRDSGLLKIYGVEH
jgi:hypothetical protein